MLSKLRNLFGLNDPVEYDYEDEEDESQGLYQENSAQPVPEQDRSQGRRGERMATVSPARAGSTNNVVEMPKAFATLGEVVVMEPREFEEISQAIQLLRERKPVVLNLAMMDPQQAHRAVDFVAGGAYAIEGHQQRIGEKIFLFTPLCVQITTPPRGVAPVFSPQRVHLHPMTSTSAEIAQSSRGSQLDEDFWHQK